MAILTKIKPYVFALIVGLGISVIGLIAYFVYKNQEKVLSLNLPKAYIVQSGSMEPAIKTGSVVISYPSSSYSHGDVITFRKSENSKTLITHRIEARFFPDGVGNKPVFATSGDANTTLDTGLVSENQVVGKVVANIPYLGYLANYAKKPFGFILLVIVPATIVIYEELKTLFSEIIKFLKKIFYKIKGKNNANPKESSGSNVFPKASVLLPLFGAGIAFLGITAAFFSDIEKSAANVLGAGTFSSYRTAYIYNSDPYTCQVGATNDQGTVYGTFKAKVIGDKLVVSAEVVGATPQSSYDLWVNQYPGGCPLPSPTYSSAITTDNSGNGSIPDHEVSLVPNAESYWISLVGGGQVLRSKVVSF